MADITLSSLLDAVYPSDEATGIPLLAPIWVVFSVEMDEDSIRDNLFVEGPNTDTWSGPDMVMWNRPPEFTADKDELFASSGKGGFVDGEITFERVSNSDISSGYSGFDYSGAGNLYRTKVIFTPTRPYVATHQYHIHLIGKDSAGNKGIRKRSVFDTQKITGTGTATCTVGGSYIGNANSDKFYIEITTGGEVGDAYFKWWRETNPIIVHGPYKTKTSRFNLEDGVYVTFSATGSFDVGDRFSCVVSTPDEATGEVLWSFTSGSGSIQTVPSSASTSVIGIQTSSTTSSGVAFEVDETDPANREYNIPLAEINPITIAFTKDLDASSITQDKIKIRADAVVDDPYVTVPERANNLPKRIVVSTISPIGYIS